VPGNRDGQRVEDRVDGQRGLPMPRRLLKPPVPGSPHHDVPPGSVAWPSPSKMSASRSATRITRVANSTSAVAASIRSSPRRLSLSARGRCVWVRWRPFGTGGRTHVVPPSRSNGTPSGLTTRHEGRGKPTARLDRWDPPRGGGMLTQAIEEVEHAGPSGHRQSRRPHFRDGPEQARGPFRPVHRAAHLHRGFADPPPLALGDGGGCRRPMWGSRQGPGHIVGGGHRHPENFSGRAHRPADS